MICNINTLYVEPFLDCTTFSNTVPRMEIADVMGARISVHMEPSKLTELASIPDQNLQRADTELVCQVLRISLVSCDFCKEGPSQERIFLYSLLNQAKFFWL